MIADYAIMPQYQLFFWEKKSSTPVTRVQAIESITAKR